jgi:hypothetical protein
VSGTTSKEIGEHAGCGGVILYTSDGRTFGLRRCVKCGADGRYGRLSPDTVEEVARREALTRQAALDEEAELNAEESAMFASEERRLAAAERTDEERLNDEHEVRAREHAHRDRRCEWKYPRTCGEYAVRETLDGRFLCAAHARSVVGGGS